MSTLKRNLSKGGYLASHFLSYALVPRSLYNMRLRRLLHGLSDDEQAMLRQRVDYYNRLHEPTPIKGGTLARDYRFPFRQKRRFTTYFFDFYDVIKYFSGEKRFLFTPGDITEIPPAPTFVKSRPIEGDNAHSVLLKLNKRRHFTLVNHDKPFSSKKNMLVGRTAWANSSPQRRLLYEKFWNHPLCNVGKTHREDGDDSDETVKPFMTRGQQLDYKFIACIEGVDVATSLKWVMSSNSVAVSPPMHYETWFMEGTLIPDYHYIEVKPDYSDLIEKLNYYIAHPDEAELIVSHAHEYMEQFRNEKLERAIQIAVAQKYFDLTN
jgi:hypothetical protein